MVKHVTVHTVHGERESENKIVNMVQIYPILEPINYDMTAI